MAAPDYVPVAHGDRPRQLLDTPGHGGWTATRPGDLTDRQPAGLAPGELTAVHAIHDALVLMSLARIETRGACGRRSRHRHQGQTETGQNRRPVHDFLLLLHKGRKSALLPLQRVPPGGVDTPGEIPCAALTP
jgi:hypothetical protein